MFVKADWEKTEVASVLTARLLVPIYIKAIVLFALVAKSGEIHLANAQLVKSKRMESAEWNAMIIKSWTTMETVWIVKSTKSSEAILVIVVKAIREISTEYVNPFVDLANIW